MVKLVNQLYLPTKSKSEACY